MRFLFGFYRKLKYIPLSANLIRLSLKAVLFEHRRYLIYCALFALTEIVFFVVSNYDNLSCQSLKYFLENGKLFFFSPIRAEDDFLFLILLTFAVNFVQNCILLIAIEYAAAQTYKKGSRYTVFKIFQWTVLDFIILLVTSIIPLGFLFYGSWIVITFFILPLLVLIHLPLHKLLKISYVIALNEIFGVLSVELFFEFLFFCIAFVFQLLLLWNIELISCTLSGLFFIGLLFYLNAVAALAQTIVAYLLLKQTVYFKRVVNEA